MKREPPKPRKVFVRVADLLGVPSTLDLLGHLGTITSMIPPSIAQGRPYWHIELENAAWPQGPLTEAHVSISTHKEGNSASLTAEITL